MDEIEERLYHDLNLEIDIPSKCETVIKEGLNKKRHHYSLIKIVTTACASLLITAGMVYASTTIIEKIWKQPEKVVGISEKQNRDEITKEDKESVMSEKEARSKAKEILEKFGHKNEEINLIELDKYSEDNIIEWYIQADNGNTFMSFNARNPELYSISFNNKKEENIEKYRTTKEEAEKTARKLCERYGYDVSEYTNVEISSNGLSEQDSYYWYVTFYKVYDGIVNKYEKIYISFVPEIDSIRDFRISPNSNYENNVVEISEEKASEIAVREEQKTNIKYSIKNTEIELDIVKMNSNAYARTTDYKRYCEERNNTDYPEEKNIYYYINSRTRKAWKIRIEYDIPVSEIFTETFNHQSLGYIYYVDATTGEIIGGEDYDKSIVTRYENGELVVVN